METGKQIQMAPDFAEISCLWQPKFHLIIGNQSKPITPLHLRNQHLFHDTLKQKSCLLPIYCLLQFNKEECCNIATKQFI